MLDLYKLKIFSIVVQEGSFSGAGKRLFITQSAVSQHIKELEASLGRQLFQRGWRGVKLTPHGEILHKYTGEIFMLVAKAENALTDINHLSSGRISIGTTPGIGIYLAPVWVQRFRKRYSQLTVALQTGITSQVVADVLANRLEIGIIEGELVDNQSPRLASLVLEEIEQQVVVGINHPFWGRNSVRLDELHQQSFIMRQPHSQSRIWLEHTFLQHSIKPVIGAEFDNLESIKRSLSLGTCLTILPHYVVQKEVEENLLCMIQIDGKPLVRSLKLIWDVDIHFSPITRAFLAELHEFQPKLQALIAE